VCILDHDRFAHLALAQLFKCRLKLLPVAGLGVTCCSTCGRHGSFRTTLARRLQRQQVEAPDDAAHQHRHSQYQRKIKIHSRESLLVSGTMPYLSTLSTARKASCGISTRPTCFMRFLPSFCFPEASSCATRHRHSTWRGRPCAWPSLSGGQSPGCRWPPGWRHRTSGAESALSSFR